MYGGSGMLGGGMYGSSMLGGGMYGMSGMGLGSMSGMGGMSGQPGQPGGFRHDYHTVFNGLKSLLQLAYSGLGLFSFGKLFGNMAWNLIKTIAKKFFSGAKYVYGLLFLNRVSAKIINGAVHRARSVSPQHIPSLFVKTLFGIAIACIAAVWFLNASSSLEEEEEKVKRLAARRLREIEATARELEQVRQATLLRGWNEASRVDISNPPEITPITAEEREQIFQNAWRTTEIAENDDIHNQNFQDPSLHSSQSIAQALTQRQLMLKNVWEEARKQAEEEAKKRGELGTTEDNEVQTQNYLGQELHVSDSSDSSDQEEIQKNDENLKQDENKVEEEKTNTNIDPDSNQEGPKNESLQPEKLTEMVTISVDNPTIEHIKVKHPVNKGNSNTKNLSEKIKPKAAYTTEALEKRRKRQEKIKISEEFKSSTFSRELNALENGESLQRLFLGTYNDRTFVKVQPKYTEDEKARMMNFFNKSLNSRTSQTPQEQAIISNLETPKVSTTSEPIPTGSKTPLDKSVSETPRPIMKKKPWER